MNIIYKTKTRTIIYNKLCKFNFKTIRALSLSINQKYKQLKQEIINETNYLDLNCKFTERLYHISNNLYNIPKCKECKTNNVKFKYYSQGYHTFCGAKCSQKSKNTKEKTKQTNLKRYGVENVAQSNIIKEKTKQTNLKRYGVENTFQSNVIKEKIKLTMLERYGVNHPMNSNIIKEKLKQTNLKRYGVENPQQNKLIQKKTKQTNLKRYGGNAPLCLEKIKEKTKQTNLKRYGVEYPTQSKEVQKNISKKQLKQNYNFIISSERIGKEYKCLTSLEEYNGVKGNSLKFQHIKCGYEFNSLIENGRFPRCNKCYPYNQSFYEIKTLEFCKLYYNNIQSNSRSIIPPLEIDIFIPEINLAIEFNGLYWHSEANGKDKYYHQSKTLACLEKGIDIVHIFEDEWINKQNIIQSILLNKFGQNSKKIFGRKCEIGPVDKSFAEPFMNNNHLQGFINGQHFGLAYESKLVSVMTVGKSRFDKNKDIEIYRFCSLLNHQVLGGLSKLVSYVKKTIRPDSIVTYADMRFGIGKGYQAAGFKFIGITDPGYCYGKGQQRYSRQKFMKHKLKNKLKYFNESLTERENMINNNYFRIWDCGNVIFRLDLIK